MTKTELFERDLFGRHPMKVMVYKTRRRHLMCGSGDQMRSMCEAIATKRTACQIRFPSEINCINCWKRLRKAVRVAAKELGFETSHESLLVFADALLERGENGDRKALAIRRLVLIQAEVSQQ